MRPLLQKALTSLVLAVLLAATTSVTFAQNDPHHPDGVATVSPDEEQPGPAMATEHDLAVPDGTPGPDETAACPEILPMMDMMMGSPADGRPMAMQMMQMMQGIAGTQMQMMQGMAGMQMQMMQNMQMMQEMQLEMVRAMQSMQQQMMRMQQMLGDQRPAMEQP